MEDRYFISGSDKALQQLFGFVHKQTDPWASECFKAVLQLTENCPYLMVLPSQPDHLYDSGSDEMQVQVQIKGDYPSHQELPAIELSPFLK
jgi:hypothetical protein